jgi:hypothetical protein
MRISEMGYGELDALGVPFLVDHHIDYAGDAARLVQAAVHVENLDGLQETLDWKVAGDDVFRANEVSGRSTVNQCLHRHLCGSLNRLQVQWDVQGVLAFNRVNDVLLGKLLFLLRAMDVPKQACPRSWLGDRGLYHCPHSWLGGSAGFRLQNRRKSFHHSDGDWDGGAPLATASESNIVII